MDPTILLIGALAVAGVVAALPALGLMSLGPTGRDRSASLNAVDGRDQVLANTDPMGLVDDPDEWRFGLPNDPRGITDIEQNMGSLSYNPTEVDISRGGLLGHSFDPYHKLD